jgi:hypothetical protein
MRSFLHAAQDESESLEVGTLGGSQWVCLEERHHPIDQLAATLHGEAKQHLPMIERTMLLDDAPAPEDLSEDFEGRPRRCSLDDGELVLDLPAEPTPGVSHHRDREAPFAVDEADDPLRNTWSFLLIDRTGRIVTAHAGTPYEGGVTVRTSTAGYTVFPAFGQLHYAESLPLGAASCAHRRGLP